MKILKLKDGRREYYYVWLVQEPRSYGTHKRGVAVSIEKDSWDKDYNVTRWSISDYGKGPKVGSGWGLYQHLPNKQLALKAAKQALSILIKQKSKYT